MGPLDFTLAGQPVSMVQLDEPDFARYPKFREALAAGCTADLEPGDALYIPYMWWHHVRMTGPFNVLVNFWWARGTAGPDPPSTAWYTASPPTHCPNLSAAPGGRSSPFHLRRRGRRRPRPAGQRGV